MPTSASVLFDDAMHHHQAGRLGQAADGYRWVLGAAPDYPYALHGLGVIALQTGRNDEARRLIERAIALEPAFAEAYVNRGNLLRADKRSADAEKACRRALWLRSDNAEAAYNLGILLQMRGDGVGAAICYDWALALVPAHVKALNNRGILHKLAGHQAEAAGCFDRALAIRPDFAEAWYNLGVTLTSVDAAFPKAIRAYRNAIALRPAYGEAHNNLGLALYHRGRPGAAETVLIRALVLLPGRSEVVNNLGLACQGQGRIKDALACYDQALKLWPDFAEAHNNRGMALLSKGDFAAGWPEREWRWRTPHFSGAAPSFPVPLWRGEPAAGARILIHAEQGYGDSIQFCRYIPLLAERGLRVLLSVPGPLKKLLAGLAGVERLLDDHEAMPTIDYHCPMMSLPLAFSTTAGDIPRQSPYLAAPPEMVERWRSRFAADGACRVGLAWAGSSRSRMPDLAALDRRRSLPPDHLAMLAGCEGVTFYGLQKTGPLAPPAFPLIDLMRDVEDFADTAALLAHLDLVISVDTAVAHLAGALGKPVWLLNRFDGCWRWLMGRDDSPWYPTLRLFRQPKPGDWPSVLTAVSQALNEQAPLLGGRRRMTP